MQNNKTDGSRSTRMSITLPEEVMDRLKDLCILQGKRSLTSLIREILERHCAESKPVFWKAVIK